MPTSTEVTQDYRLALGATTNRLARQIEERARAATVADIDGWWRTQQRPMTRLIVQGFIATTNLAVRYLAALAGIARSEVDPVEATADLARITTSLHVVGPVGFKTNLARFGATDAALRVMTDRLVGSGRRLALAGARETTMATIEAAPQIVGYRRVTGGSPCKFCEMLAGRGAVYRTEARAGVVGATGRIRGNQPAGRAFHDHCSCTTEPVWS